MPMVEENRRPTVLREKFPPIRAGQPQIGKHNWKRKRKRKQGAAAWQDRSKPPILVSSARFSIQFLRRMSYTAYRHRVPSAPHRSRGSPTRHCGLESKCSAAQDAGSLQEELQKNCRRTAEELQKNCRRTADEL
ncbi:uncharacterized protein UV8b_04821 [Ustilaginoidea virens]|uniref:Uncharacterized protein n=1 Tax=Ustilaginoidea virens TaxID=1159556 RepID=A0A8E5HSJ5_USTVR|nr:uncharacterized protein UV8b_04821 [Ustilaginoidea virens]QUC20580.1 hypothetical protein UV8b_04821 [Ustilaginoidea virens]